MARRRNARKRCAGSPGYSSTARRRFSPRHVALFDDVIGCLIEQIEVKALAELARRIAPVANAPAGVVRTLAHHDDIAVAEPMLRRARLEEGELLRIAETKSQAHLLALSARRGVGETLSDILVARGNREVSRALADQQ